MEEKLSAFRLYDNTEYIANIVEEYTGSWLLENIRGNKLIDSVSLSKDAVVVHFTVLRGGLYDRENDTSSST